MKDDVFVSVIINNYNYEEFIKSAIESVLTQSYKNFELIIVDDGSTDNSKEIIRKYENYKKVKIIYSQNIGQASAMNLGVINSKGELIAFLDSDDIFHKNKLQKVVEIFKNGHEFIFHDYKFLSKIKNLEKNNVYKYGGYYSFLVYYLNKYIGDMTSTLVLSRRLIDKIFPLGNISEWKISSDALIVFSASLISDVYYEKTSLIEYRVHENNSFYSKKISPIKYHRRLININWQKQKFIKEELIDIMYFRNSYNLLSEFRTHDWVDRSLLKDYYTVLFREMNLPLINKILTAYKLYKVYLKKRFNMSEKLKWALNITNLENFKIENPKKFVKKTITKKGVLWLGQTCNLSCYFCYFAKKISDSDDIYHDFMPIEKAKKICHTLRYIYGNTSIDIQGGEPTIYPKIFELVEYCHEIGLEPTLITNGYVLHKKNLVEEYKRVGIKDFLISVHTLGEDYDKIVGLKGASEKQMKAIKNLQEVGIPFRFNCTLTRQVFDGIKDISKLAVLTHAKAVNFIVFNPNEDQANNKETRTISNVPKYSEISEVLENTIEFLEKNDIEVNIRYLPLCMMSKEYRKNIYGMYQVPYDHNEWDFNSWTWTTRLNQRTNTKELDDPLPILLYNLKEFNNIDFTQMTEHGTTNHYLKDINLQEHLIKLFSAHIPKKQLYYNNSKLRVEKHLQYKKSDKCLKCDVQNICDGIHRDYLILFGDEEISPITVGKRVKNPKYYIKKQWKRK